MLNTQQSIWACYEIGLMKYKLRTSYGHGNNTKFQDCYSKCLENAKEKYNPEIKDVSSYYLNKLIILEKYQIILEKTVLIQSLNLGNFDELKIKSLDYIIKETFPTSFTIIDSSKGCFIIIPITWTTYLLCEPIKSIVIKLNYTELFNVIFNSL